MDRRAALQRISMLLGAAVSAPTASALLAGCRAPNGAAEYAPVALTHDQFDLVGLVAETIIPETETPGALAAGVDGFIDTLLADYYPPNESAAFRTALDGFRKRLDEAGPRAFARLDAAGRDEVLAPIDRAAYLPAAFAGPTRDAGDPFTPDGFYRRLKELVVVGFYTSQAGATRELTPNPMGLYRADVPLAEIGRAWA